MKTAIVAAVAVLALYGCATPASKPKAVVCHNEPQWYTNDGQGKPVNAVYVCFGESHELLYDARPITEAQRQALIPKVDVVGDAPAPKRPRHGRKPVDLGPTIR